jgi:H+-transporting ATPase
MEPHAAQPTDPKSRPGAPPESKDDLKSIPMAELQAKLGSSPDGLFRSLGVARAEGDGQWQFE